MAASPRKVTTSLPHGIPADLAADGSKYTILTTTTHQKRLEDNNMDTPTQHVKQSDFEDSYWHIHKQGVKGFEFSEKLKGRPYADDIRDLFGPGVYRAIPVGPDGRPIDTLAEIHKVRDPTADMQKKAAGTPANGAGRPGTPADWGMANQQEMPAWMRYQLQREGEEKADARRRADEADAKREEWERTQRDREYDKSERSSREDRERRDAEAAERRERYEREERERHERDARDRKDREAKEDREREERTHRTQMMATLAGSATTIISSFLESNRARAQPQGKDINEVLLQAMMQGNKGTNVAMKDQIEILLALDQLRKPDPSDAPAKDEESEMMKMLGMAAPLLGALRGGGGGGGGGGQQQQMPPQANPMAIAAQVLMDPEAVSRVAMQNPQAIAASVVQAVKGNPVLKAAVVSEFENMGD